MIKHIVLWKIDSSYSADEKKDIKNTVAEKLLALKGKIEDLKSIAVFFNDDEASEANADIILDTDFENIQALNNYQVHPEHQKVVTYVKTLKLQRLAIDYNY